MIMLIGILVLLFVAGVFSNDAKDARDKDTGSKEAADSANDSEKPA